MTDYIEGVDVSHYQRRIEWPKVAHAGYRFAFVKACEGATLPDPMFGEYWLGARDAGLIRGAYLFGHPRVSARQQVQLLHTMVGNLAPGDLPPVLDFETNDGLDREHCREWLAQALTAMEDIFQRRPILYAAAGWLRGAIGGADAFVGYPLWVANYTSRAEPLLPAGFDRWLFWQYTSAGFVDGIIGRCDLNRFAGTDAELQRLAGYVVPPTIAEATVALNKPIVAIVNTHTAQGYWLVAADGGVFAYGDAADLGAGDPLPGLNLNAPIIGACVSRDGHGLVLAGADGGVFPLGDAVSYGQVPA